MDLLLPLPIPQTMQMIIFSFYSSSKAKKKNGSSPKAGKKLIALNQIKNVVVCLRLWKETRAGSFWKHHKGKINFLLIKCFPETLFLLLLINIAFWLALGPPCSCSLGLELWPTLCQGSFAVSVLYWGHNRVCLCLHHIKMHKGVFILPRQPTIKKYLGCLSLAKVFCSHPYCYSISFVSWGSRLEKKFITESGVWDQVNMLFECF